MNKRVIYILSLLLAGSGCATLQSTMQNDPSFQQPTGNRVSIDVRGQKGKDLNDTIIGKTLKAEASKWLTTKGYVVVEEKKKADTGIVFGVAQKTNQEYVPGQTYSVPVYGGNSSTTTVKGAYGQTLGTLETAPSNPYAPTGYQTHYREGYTATVTDRWLFLTLWSLSHGRPPMKVSEGRVYPEERDQQFYESNQVMSRAVGRLLSQSVLGSVERAPASASDGNDPGCWLRLGITFDQEKLSRGAKIKDFSPGSKVIKSGLKIGDVVYSIGGKDVPLASPVRMTENSPVSVVGSRDGKDFRIEALPTMLCVED